MNESTTNDEMAMVLYVLIRKSGVDGQPPRFLLIEKNGSATFPPTKFRPAEDLYSALIRPMEQDLGQARGTYFVERELAALPNSGESPRYPGLKKEWLLYPVIVSLTSDVRAALSCQYSGGYEPADAETGSSRLVTPAVLGAASMAWLTLDELAAATDEPNTHAIIAFLRDEGAKTLGDAPLDPSMDARANYWARFHDGGVRIVRGETVKGILASGERAFNLRVADPYLPYQRQGLGFTWSFFTPRDKQDLHVHGLPAVEIYGVLAGRLMLWHKPMSQRGVRTWQSQILEAGDWAEVEPLHCHFAAWLTPEGLGTVIKAAGSGELAGVGRLGVSGKTVCDWSDKDDSEDIKKRKRCSNHGCCIFPPSLGMLMDEYAKPWAERDYARIGNEYSGGCEPALKVDVAECREAAGS